MNKLKLRQILKRFWPLEIFLMAIPTFLLIAFGIDVFHGFFIFDLMLPFSKETILTIFMTYELILSFIVAMSLSYLIAIIITKISEKEKYTGGRH
jgi:hypothetical protein